MDVREKLAELIAQKVCDAWSESCDEWLPHDCGKCYANDCHISEIADHLISNGVTVQEWISVKDRLPEEKGRYLTANKSCGDKIVVFDLWFDGGFWYVDEEDDVFDFEVTHWMPMPNPPKGE